MEKLKPKIKKNQNVKLKQGGNTCISNIEEYLGIWRNEKNLIFENLLKLDKKSGQFQLSPSETADLECTILFCIFNLLSDLNRQQLNFCTLKKYSPDSDLLEEGENNQEEAKVKNAMEMIALEEQVLKHDLLESKEISKRVRESVQEGIDNKSNKWNEEDIYKLLNINKILFSEIGETRKIERNWSEIKIADEELQEYIMQNPEFSFKYHLLEPYFRPTNICYFYNSFYHYLRDNENSPNSRQIPKALLKGMDQFLKEEKKNFEDMENINPSKFLIVFHYLIQLFTFFPISNLDQLKELRKHSEEFRLLPQPYGLMADELVELLENEIRCPGTALFYKLIEDFPGIEIYSSNHSETKYTDTYVAYFITDAITSKKNYNYDFKIFQEYPSFSLDPYLQEKSNILRKFLVLFTFKNFGLLNQDTLSQLKTKDHTIYFNMYSKIIEIMDYTDELSTVKCIDYLKKALVLLSENIPKEKSTIPEDECFKNGIYTPKYPDIPIKMMPLSRAFKKELWQKFNKFSIRKFESYNPALKLIIYADDAIFHKFINNYCSLMFSPKLREATKSKALKMDKMDIRIYLIPYKYNSLARYLAVYDEVYAIEIYLPFTKKPLLPKFKRNIIPIQKNRKQDQPHPDTTNYKEIKKILTTIKKSISSEGAIPPLEANDRQIQLYLREATRNFKLKVYRVALFKSIDWKDPEKVVYFCSRIEVGFF